MDRKFFNSEQKLESLILIVFESMSLFFLNTNTLTPKSPSNMLTLLPSVKHRLYKSRNKF